MTKPEMISSIAERTGLKKVTIEKVVSEFLEVVGDNLANGEEVNFIGFGISDSQLYKQAGNSITVNVLEEIFKNLLK